MAFERGQPLAHEVMTKEPAPEGKTNRAVNLSSVEGYDSLPSYLPNGKIAFTSKRDGDYDLYLMRAARQGPRNVPVKLTKNAVNDLGPGWSPSGTQLVFNSNRSGNSEVYRMKAAPQGRLNKPINLSRNPADDTSPTWSPDGRKVAFNSDRLGSDDTTDLDIWRMRATDGANPTNLTDNAVVDFDPGWQPVP